jgi:hypothetical protein
MELMVWCQKYGPQIRGRSKFASSQLNGVTLVASPGETVHEKGKHAEEARGQGLP